MQALVSSKRAYTSLKRAFKSPKREFKSPKRALLMRIPISTMSMVGAVLIAIVRIWVSFICIKAYQLEPDRVYWKQLASESSGRKPTFLLAAGAFIGRVSFYWPRALLLVA